MIGKTAAEIRLRTRRSFATLFEVSPWDMWIPASRVFPVVPDYFYSTAWFSSAVQSNQVYRDLRRHR